MRFCSDHREQRTSAGPPGKRASPHRPGEEVRRPLGIRGRPDHVGRRSVADMPEPPSDVGRLVLSDRHIGASHGTEERRAHLGGQLLPAVPLTPEPDRLGDPRPVQPGGVPGPVGQLVGEGRVVGRLARADLGLVTGYRNCLLRADSRCLRGACDAGVGAGEICQERCVSARRRK